jgi:hypothetical protein
MTQPAAASSSSDTADAKSAARETEALRNALLGELAQQKRAEARKDSIGAHFTIRFTVPLPELDTRLAKAYQAVDERDAERHLYALICATDMPPRGKLLRELQVQTIPHFTNILAAGAGDFASLPGRRMAIVLERPKGQSLASMIQQSSRTLTEAFISEKIIVPLAEVLRHFEEMGSAHGRLNPANIFLGDTLMLGECVSEPCGYSQPFTYEPIERAQAHPAGKGEGTSHQDYFALGVLVARLRGGANVFARSQTLESHLELLTHDGACVALTQRLDVSDTMTDFFCGTLTDHPAERWGKTQVKAWLGGRRFNMVSPAIPPVGSRPYFIGEHTYTNFRGLSQGLYAHWDQVATMLRDGSLVRWIELSARRRDIGDLVRRSMQSLSSTTLKAHSNNDELIARCLTIIDPSAPMRIREAACHPDGVGPMLAEFMHANDTHGIDMTMDLLRQGLSSIWADMHKKREERLSSEMSSALWALDRLRLVLRSNGLGYGLERCLYDLNPDLPCQSPLLAGQHVVTVRDLLLVLERIAPDKARGSPLLDRHIAAFMASKLNIMRELKVSELAYFPALAKHPGVMTLRLFQQAQDNVGNPKLPALSYWIAVELLPALELFNSKSLREQLQNGVRTLAPSGFLHPMMDFLNQQAFVETDQGGFVKAFEEYHAMAEEISLLQSKRRVMERAKEQGAVTAKTISYVTLLGVFLFMLQHLFK